MRKSMLSFVFLCVFFRLIGVIFGITDYTDYTMLIKEVLSPFLIFQFYR